MRSRIKLAGIVAVAGVFALMVSSANAEDKKPDATIEFTGGSVAAGVGYTWGSGTLTYKGAKYPISVSGLSVGASAGVTNITAKGSVYDLKKLEDLDGNFTAGGAGATAAGGVAAVTMKNQNGVVIDVVATTQGLKLSLDAAGVSIKLKK